MSALIPHFLGNFATNTDCEAFVAAGGWVPERTASSATPCTTLVAGLMYRNTTLNQLRYYDGTQWRAGDKRVVDVTMFGARGDGSTDDTAAIQAAIEAAESKWDVYFPTGVYVISACIFLRDRLGAALNGVTIRGDGPSSIIEANFANDAETSGASVFFGNLAVSDLVFKDFVIRPHAGGGYQRGFRFVAGASRVCISHVDIVEAGWDGLHAAQGAGVWFDATSTDCIVEDCNITDLAASNPGSIGICFYTGAGIIHYRPIVRRNKITGQAGLLPAGGIWCFNSNDPVIEGNFVKDIGSRLGFEDQSGYGILAYGLVDDASFGARITQNHVETTNGSGIYAQNTARAIIEANHVLDTCKVQDGASLLTGGICCNIGPGVIANNIIKDVGVGNVSLAPPAGISISCAPDAGVWPSAVGASIRVVGNFVENALLRGIRLRGVVHGAVIEGNTTLDCRGGIGNVSAVVDFPSGCTIVGNTVLRQGAAVSSHAGIGLANPVNVTIANNVVSRADGQGILIISGSFCTITGNIVRDSGQALANSYDGIDLQTSTDLVVSGNSSWGVQQRYGIVGSGTYLTVVGNAFGGDSGGISFPGPPANLINEHNQDVNIP